MRGFKYITSLAGRIRHPVLTKGKGKGKGKGGITSPILKPTQIVNFPIQSTCTDYLETSVRLLSEYIRKYKIPARIVLTAHDEILVECPADIAPQIVQLVEDIMVVAAQKITEPILPNAPLEVDTAIGNSWADKP